MWRVAPPRRPPPFFLNSAALVFLRYLTCAFLGTVDDCLVIHRPELCNLWTRDAVMAVLLVGVRLDHLDDLRFDLEEKEEREEREELEASEALTGGKDTTERTASARVEDASAVGDGGSGGVGGSGGDGGESGDGGGRNDGSSAVYSSSHPSCAGSSSVAGDIAKGLFPCGSWLLPALPTEVWLLILEFVPVLALGRPNGDRPVEIPLSNR